MDSLLSNSTLKHSGAKTKLINSAHDFIRVHKISKDRNKLNLLHSCEKLPTLRAVVP